MCVFFSLRYPACNAHALYCHLWPARLNNIFPHNLIKGMILKKNIEQKMCVLIFSAASVWNTSYSKKNGATYGQKLVLMYSARYSCPIFMKLEFSRQISEKYSKNFHENSWSGSRWNSILTTLTDVDRTRMANIYCVYTVLRYSWWWTVDISETCRVLYQINLRNCASRWLSL